MKRRRPAIPKPETLVEDRSKLDANTHQTTADVLALLHDRQLTVMQTHFVALIVLKVLLDAARQTNNEAEMRDIIDASVKRLLQTTTH